MKRLWDMVTWLAIGILPVWIIYQVGRAIL